MDRPLIREVAQLVVSEAKPLKMNGYKLDLARTTIEPVLAAIAHGPNVS